MQCLSKVVVLFSLEDVLMQDGRLYLVFEYLAMDLKKYMDLIPRDKFMDMKLIKVFLAISTTLFFNTQHSY